MSFRRLVIALTFLAIFTMATRFSLDSDSWWHLRVGERIVEQGAVPKTDSYSFTRTDETWRYPSAAWLSESAMYLMYEYLGPGGVNLWVAAMVTAAFGYVWLSMSGGAFARAFILILAVTVSGVYWAARPYMVSFLLAAATLWILESFRWRRAKLLFWLPVMMLVWANAHPGFAIGFILVGIYGLDALLRSLAAAHKEKSLALDAGILREELRSQVLPFLLPGALMLLAVMVNPSGPVMLRYPFETLSIGVLRDFIQEWQSPNFHLLGLQPFIWLLLLVLASFAATRKRVALIDFLLVAAFGYMALLAGRNVALFALVAPVALSRYAAPLLDGIGESLGLSTGVAKQTHAKAALNLGIAALALLVVLLRLSQVWPVQANEEVWAEQLPLGAVEYLEREQPDGRLFNSYNWGGYLIWRLRDYPVFVDGRTDLYDDELLSQWLEIVGAEEGWQSQLDDWQIDLILLEPHWPVVKVLDYEGWQLLYEDEGAVLYARSNEDR